MGKEFLSTPSARRATSRALEGAACLKNFYPRPPRGGRHRARRGYGHRPEISIHALREEGDPTPTAIRSRSWNFYPRPPRGGRRRSGRSACRLRRDFYPRPPRGGRLHLRPSGPLLCLFLSTPSARRATFQCGRHDQQIGFLSTPSARRATDLRPDTRARVGISIHALREEGDRTLPHDLGEVILISIHALREEGDGMTRIVSWYLFNFYPRPPRGGRPADYVDELELLAISIHALREEGDALSLPTGWSVAKFLSTPSARRATPEGIRLQGGARISIHALREEGDRRDISAAIHAYISIHALREEGDSKNRDKISIFL